MFPSLHWPLGCSGPNLALAHVAWVLIHVLPDFVFLFFVSLVLKFSATNPFWIEGINKSNNSLINLFFRNKIA